MPRALPWVADSNLGVPRIVYKQRARKLRRRGVALEFIPEGGFWVWYEHVDNFTLRVNQHRIRRKLAVALRHAVQKYGRDWPRHLLQMTIGGPISDNGMTITPMHIRYAFDMGVEPLPTGLDRAYLAICEGGTGGPCTQPDCEVCWPEVDPTNPSKHVTPTGETIDPTHECARGFWSHNFFPIDGTPGRQKCERCGWECDGPEVEAD